MAKEKTDYKGYLKQIDLVVAGYMKDRYPQVKELIFELNYHGDLTQPFSKRYVLTPEQHAIFKFDCPFRDCVDGGHDLTHPTFDMINNHKSEYKGRVLCQGWQDRERIGKHRCLCELNYKVIALYKNPD